MKKVFGGSALVVAVLIGSMMAAVVPVEPAVAAPDGETDCGDDVGEGVPTFTVTDLVVSSGGDCTGAVKIPAGVIEIGGEAFRNSGLESIEIPAGVTVIGRNAFRNSGLESIEIPASVTKVNFAAFRDTSSLTTVTFARESQLETIDQQAFMFSAVESIEIPASVTSIGPFAFAGPSNLSNLTFAEGSKLERIGGSAFLRSGLTSVAIPATVSSIGPEAFAETKSLDAVTFAPDSQLAEIAQEVFQESAVKNIVIPPSVTSIDNSAFAGSGLTSVAIPATVSSIGLRAFAETKSLDAVTFAPDSQLAEIAQEVFQESAVKNIVIPPSVTSIDNSAFAGSGLTSAEIPASVTSIKVSAFEGSEDLVSITFLGNEPVEVGDDAFKGLADGATAFIRLDATGFDVRDGLWNLLLVVRADPPAPPATTPSATTPSRSAVSPALHLDARFRVGELVANQTVLAEGQGLQPRADFSLTLRSTPQILASGVANSGGSFSRVVSVPSGIPAGFHTITLNATGVGGEPLTLVAGFTVDERGVVTSVTPNVNSSAPELAATGPDRGVLTVGAFAGGLALLVGVLLMGARRFLARGMLG